MISSGRIVRGAVYGFAAIGVLFTVVTVTPLVSWCALRLAGPFHEPKGDTLIVLGGSMAGQGVIGRNSYWRAVYASRVYRSGAFRRVIVSGGPPSNPVAAEIKRFLVYEGVPAAAIDTETESTDTHTNALHVGRILGAGAGRAVLLTSDYHTYRASRALAKAGVKVTASPFPDAVKESQYWLGRWPAFLEVCVEAAKIAYYSARGWI